MNDEPEDDDIPAVSSGGPFDEGSPHAIEQIVLAVSRKSTSDTLAAALDASDWLMARAKGISELAKRIAIDWIENNGELCIGEIQYSVGYVTTVKCVDTRGCGHELLRALGGDFEQYLQILVAQPYKHGAASTILEKPLYRSFFTTKRSGRLINGIPERMLKRADKHFISEQGRR
jgi:hypothetical protein